MFYCNVPGNASQSTAAPKAEIKEILKKVLKKTNKIRQCDAL